MSHNHGSGPECVRIDHPVCRFLDDCELIMVRGGCRTCALAHEPSDEDGDWLIYDSMYWGEVEILSAEQVGPRRLLRTARFDPTLAAL